MVADFSKLLNHPDKDEIVSKLMTGVSPKQVADWLKLKYADKEQSHLRISSNNLKDFTDNNLDLYSQLRNDIEGISSGQKAPPKEIAESLKNNKTYQERLIDLADKEIDIKQIIKETVMMVRARAIQVFDKIQSNPENTKPDYTLIKWFETLINAAEKYDKIVNESPDMIVEHKVTMEIVENRLAIFQEAVRETALELDPEIAFLFMDNLTRKLEALQEPQIQVLGQEKRLVEAKILSTAIAEQGERDEFSSEEIEGP